MRSSILILLVVLAGCSNYSNLQWGNGVAWEQARDRSQAQITQLANAVFERHQTTASKPSQAAVRPTKRAIPDSHRHVVMPGDTLSEIASSYDIGLAKLAAMNGLSKPYTIMVGQELWLRSMPSVPATYRVAAGDTFIGIANRYGLRFDDVRGNNPGVDPNRLIAGQSLNLAASAQAAPTQRRQVAELSKASRVEVPVLSNRGFMWPVDGQIVDKFGAKPNGTRNDGINISAARGATVKAAEAGVVVYAGEAVPGMGRMLMIQHDNEYLSAYGHNETLLVVVGDTVERGQPIAKVGRTGNVDRAQLHFQIRKGTDPLDPLEVFRRGGTKLASSS